MSPHASWVVQGVTTSFLVGMEYLIYLVIQAYLDARHDDKMGRLTR